MIHRMGNVSVDLIIITKVVCVHYVMMIYWTVKCVQIAIRVKNAEMRTTLIRSLLMTSAYVERPSG